MIERDSLGKQEEWRGIDRMCLSAAELLVAQINLIAADRPTELPEVNSNLIRATCDRDNFKQ